MVLLGRSFEKPSPTASHPTGTVHAIMHLLVSLPYKSVMIAPRLPVRRRPRLLQERPPGHVQRDSGGRLRDDPKEPVERQPPATHRDHRDRTVPAPVLPRVRGPGHQRRRHGTATTGAVYLVKFPGAHSPDGMSPSPFRTPVLQGTQEENSGFL